MRYFWFSVGEVSGASHASFQLTYCKQTYAYAACLKPEVSKSNEAYWRVGRREPIYPKCEIRALVLAACRVLRNVSVTNIRRKYVI